MADRVKKVNYCHVIVPSRAKQGVVVLAELKEAGINLVGFTGFPGRPGKAQLDLVGEDMTSVRRLAKRNGWKLSKVKKAFHIQGTDVVGAVERHVEKLADENISVTAATATSAGKKRYGMILWVKPKVYSRAARVLKAK